MSDKSKKLGRYEILGQLGKGGMGVVVKAYDPNVDRIVAIKTIKNSEIAEPEKEKEMIQRFYLEAKATAKLSHPNIVTLHDMDKGKDTAYIVMEYVEGGTLSSLVSEKPVMDENRLLKYMKQIASGLDYAHSKGILHRDIKPANIMVTKDGNCKIADFGLARLASTTGITSTGRAVGSPSYMSPEQVQEMEVDSRSDQYSLGVVFYELVTGTRPFIGNTISSVILKIIRDNPIPPTLLNSRLYPAVDNVVMKVLAKNPKSRYPNCTAFVNALERAVKGLDAAEDGHGYDSSNVSTLAIDTHPKKAARKKSVLVWGMITLLLLVVGGSATYFYYGDEILGLMGKTNIAMVTPTPTPNVKSPPITSKVKPSTPEPVKKALVSPPDVTIPEPVAKKPIKEPNAQKTTVTTPVAKAKPPQIPPTGFLSINASPQAEIYVDGEYIGHGPVEKKKVTAGKHTLLVKMEGYKDWKKEVTIAENKDLLIKLTATLITGSLRVAGPAGANVYLNEKNVGTAPFTKKLQPGEYDIKLTVAGKKPWLKKVTVTANKVSSLNPQMATAVGRFTLISTPKANWFLDGKQMGNTPIVDRELPIGQHSIRVAAKGYQPFIKNIRINTNKLTLEEITLLKLAGILKITANHPAVIYLDGKKMGDTPMNIRDIQVGKHTVKLENSSFNSFKTTFEVSEGETKEISHIFGEKVASLPPEGLQKGTKAPNIVGRTLDGKIYRLYKSEAKMKAITFWSIKSKISKSVIPELARLEKKYPDVEFVAVHSIKAKKERISTFLNNLSGIPSTIVLGKKGVKEIYEFNTFPHTVVLDYRNKTVSTITGYTEQYGQKLAGIIDNSL